MLVSNTRKNNVNVAKFLKFKIQFIQHLMGFSGAAQEMKLNHDEFPDDGFHAKLKNWKFSIILGFTAAAIILLSTMRGESWGIDEIFVFGSARI